METIVIKVQGMHCDGCVQSVTRLLQQVPGVTAADVSLARGEAHVTYDPAKAKVAELKAAVQDAGYEAA